MLKKNGWMKRRFCWAKTDSIKLNKTRITWKLDNWIENAQYDSSLEKRSAKNEFSKQGILVQGIVMWECSRMIIMLSKNYDLSVRDE